MVTREQVLNHRTDLYHRFMLTPREIEVIAELVRGQTNRQIAEAFCVVEKTVKFHLSSVYRKLGVVNRLEAVVNVDSYIRSLLPKPDVSKTVVAGTLKPMHSLLDTKV